MTLTGETEILGAKPFPLLPQEVKSKINLKYVTMFISYRAINRLGLGYKSVS